MARRLLDRHHSDAEARGDEAGYGRELRRFEGDRGREIVCGTDLVEDPSHAVAVLHHDELLVCGLGEAYRLPAREAMLAGHHEREFLFGDAGPRHVGAHRAGRDDREVGVAVDDMPDDGRRRILGQRETRRWVLHPEPADEVGHQPQPERV